MLRALRATMVASLLVALVPAAVGAHAELLSSDPAANSTLLEGPHRLSLTFTEAVDAGNLRLRLLDARGSEVAGLGTPELADDAVTVRATAPRLEPGVYTVDYRVTSAVDGHVTAGIFAFLVDPTGTQPAPGVSSETDSPSDTPEATAARWLALAAAVAMAGILAFWLFSAAPALGAAGRPPVPPWGAVAAAGLLGCVGLVAYLLLASRPLVEGSGAQADWFPLDPAGPFGVTQFAVAMRIALLGQLAATLLATAGRLVAPPGRTWMLLTLLAALLGLAGMSFAGHAAASGGVASAALDLLHLAGVAAWLGALVGVAILALRERTVVGEALRRHSRVALVAAPVVVLTGIANSPLLLGDEARDLVATGYGNLLLAKVVLFGIALALGAANFFLVRRRELRASLPVIAAELVVAAVAVAAAAGLVTGQPAAGRAPVLTRSAIGAEHLFGTAGPTTVHAAVNLPAPGPQRYQISVADAATGDYRTDVQRVFLVFRPPTAAGLSEERVRLQPSEEPGLWGAAGAYTPVVGSWELEVIVRRTGELDESVAFPLEVTLPLAQQRVPPPDTGAGVPLPLAVLWAALPGGPAGWMVPATLLGAAAGLLVLERRRRSRLAMVAQVLLVVAAVITGTGTGSRALVEAANAPPPVEAARPNPVEVSEASVQRGRALYLANCSSCHGPDGTGDGPTAAGMLPAPADLAERVPDMTDGAIAYRIAVGSAGTRMPAFAAILTEDDRWDLVNYLRDRWPPRGT